MWPGQQPPGGEQNPQDQNQNPYQQPGYQQPNPYQQPGYQQQGQQPGQQPGYGYPQQGGQGGYGQPNPYQQPTVPQYAVPGPPGDPQPGNDKKRTTVVAIVAATAVVVAAAVTGVVVLNKDDDKDGKNVADGKKSSAPAKPSGSASEANPRGGEDAKPQIAGWKVVTNPKWGTQFDVPGDWEVSPPGVLSFFEDEKKNDGLPLIGFTGPADLKEKWCTDDADKDGTEDKYSLAGAGTRGAQGATDADVNARNEAGTWAWAAFAQHMPKKSIKISKAKQYTTKSGLTGSLVTATAPNVTKRSKCSSDGKTYAFTFKNSKNEFSSWVLYAAADVDDELPNATIEKILSTVRLVPVVDSEDAS